MTPTENAAYAWLVRERGYAPADIVFQYRTSPDFRTADGRGWEVKRLNRKSATFYLSQLAIFRYEPPTVLLWRRDHDPEPAAEVDFRELPMPGDWNGFHLNVWYQPHGAYPRALYSTTAIDAALREWLTTRAKMAPKHQRPLPAGALALIA